MPMGRWRAAPEGRGTDNDQTTGQIRPRPKTAAQDAPAETRLCIEVDGAQHHFDEARAYDEKRDAYLKAHGIETLRIPAIQVMEDPDSTALYLADEIRLRLTA